MDTLVKMFLEVFAWLAQRPTLRIRIQKDDPYAEVGSLVFEAENVRDKTTSLGTTVIASFLSVKGRRLSIVFDVREADRSLPPFTAKNFSASARQRQPDRFHGWFRIYKFVPTRGRTCRVRIKNAALEPMSTWRFWLEKLILRTTGHIFGKTGGTIDEYRARQRAKGPH